MTSEDQAALDTLLDDDSSAESERPNLSLYGFADASVERMYSTGKGPSLAESPVFTVGNVNVYLASNLTHGFSSLIEVRFSYLPNGTAGASGSYETTSAADSANFGRTEQWGGIVLQRVHLDYSFRGWLNVRVGQFLTPYGIWNVDHGSPTIIGTNKPYVVGDGLFPQRQTGLEVFGSRLFGATTLGYHVTVSNGRSDVLNSDFDKNKALGGRLFLASDAIGAFKLGVSAYGGRATMQPYSGLDTTSTPPLPAKLSDNQYDELALAGDLQWDLGNLHLQGEGILRQVRYLEAGRKTQTDFTGALTGLVPDNLRWGWYGLAGYRLPWLAAMPFVLVEQNCGIAGSSPTGAFFDPAGRILTLTGGLNVRPVPSVVLKVQATWIKPPADGPGAGSLTAVSGQAAWAF
ncbi:MAG: hypothetical protein QM778_18000 [Myxococcales bacterium]